MTSTADALPRFCELRSRIDRVVAAAGCLKRWLTTIRRGRVVLSVVWFVAGKAADEVTGVVLRYAVGA